MHPSVVEKGKIKNMQKLDRKIFVVMASVKDLVVSALFQNALVD